MLKIITTIFEQQVECSLEQEVNCFTAEIFPINFQFPGDLEPGKAVSEVFSELKTQLRKNFHLSEEVLFFPDPHTDKGFFLVAMHPSFVPEKVKNLPSAWWYSPGEEWLKIY